MQTTSQKGNDVNKHLIILLFKPVGGPDRQRPAGRNTSVDISFDRMAPARFDIWVHEPSGYDVADPQSGDVIL